MSDLSWLNPTPHAIAVYASQPTSPLTTQHSLPSGRCSLLGPDFHRLDRTSFAWRTHSITSSAGARSLSGILRPGALAVRGLRIVGRIGIVFEHLRDDATSDQRLQLGLERIRFVLFVNLLALDIKRERLHVFCLLGRIVDSFFGPFIKMVIFDAVSLRLPDIVCEGVELAFRDSIMPLQYIRQRGDRRISRIAPRHVRELVAQRQPQLEFQLVVHGVLPIRYTPPASRCASLFAR